MMWRLNRRCTEKVTKLVTWCNLRDQSQNKHIFTSDDDKPTNNVKTLVLHFWCPHPSFLKFYFWWHSARCHLCQQHRIYLFDQTEQTGRNGRSNQSKAWHTITPVAKKKNRRFFFFGQFEHLWKQSFNQETISYSDFNVAKRTETETEKPNRL